MLKLKKMFKKLFKKREKRYLQRIELSKMDQEKINEKLGPLLENKRCSICKSKEIFMDGFPLKIEANKRLTKDIFHRHLFVIRYCENCGYSQFFNLKHLGIDF